MAWAYNTSDDLPTAGPQIAAIALSLTSISLIIVCLRVYVRAYMVRAFGIDDFAIVASWIGACGYTITTVVLTKWGLGLLHLEDIPPENEVALGITQYIGPPFYILGLWAFEISLLLSYLRFFPMESSRIVVIMVGVVVTLGHLSFVMVFIFSCIPISSQWKSHQADSGYCINILLFYYSFSALTVVFNILIFAIPVPILIRSKMHTTRKVALVGFFTLGLFVTVVQVIRLQAIGRLKNVHDSSRPIVLSVVEVDLGIFLACLPTLAPAVRRLKQRLDGSLCPNRINPLGSGQRRDNHVLQSLRSFLDDGPAVENHWEDNTRADSSATQHEDARSTDPMLDTHGSSYKDSQKQTAVTHVTPCAGG